MMTDACLLAAASRTCFAWYASVNSVLSVISHPHPYATADEGACGLATGYRIPCQRKSGTIGFLL